jgi:hypothetical protein
LPYEKRRAKLVLGTQRYIAAAEHLVAEDSQLATSPGRVHSDLAHELQHVSYAVQDFAAIPKNANADVHAADPQELRDSQDINVSHLQTGDSGRERASEGMTAHEAHDEFDTGNIERDAQEKYVQEPVANRKPEQIEKTLDPRTDTELEHRKDIRDDDTNVHVPVRAVDDQVVCGSGNNNGNNNAKTRWAAQNAQNQGLRQAKDEVHAQPDRAEPSPILSEILKQQDRVLQISQNATINQMEAQAVMAQHSVRIDQLIAQQRQLQGNWRRLRMEDQNRTQQNMGGN